MLQEKRFVSKKIQISSLTLAFLKNTALSFANSIVPFFHFVSKSLFQQFRLQKSKVAVSVSIFTVSLVSSCVTQIEKPPQDSIVQFYTNVPETCSSVNVLKQKNLKRVSSEDELIKHYGLTFLVRFNDGKTRPIYGTLYYSSSEENKYCMVLPDGNFAVIKDKQIDQYRKNVIQEVCYPIQECEEVKK